MGLHSKHEFRVETIGVLVHYREVFSMRLTSFDTPLRTSVPDVLHKLNSKNNSNMILVKVFNWNRSEDMKWYYSHYTITVIPLLAWLVEYDPNTICTKL